ncbi:hypothetical protein [Methylobacterium sp. P5_C11]
MSFIGQTYLDGERIAMNATRHMFKMGNRPAVNGSVLDSGVV